MKRLGVLDGLRGIAVLLVLWYHVWEISWLPAPLPELQFIPETGFVGVDLFFFISGFVIAYPFVRAHYRGEPRLRWPHFAYRRAIKIVPSYVLSILLVIAIGYAHFSSPGEAARDIIAHLLFVHTWWSSTYGSINGVLWTLAVEVQFYVVFPLLWFAFARGPWATALAMVAVSIVYRVQALHCCLVHAEQLIYNLPGYLDIFACGMIGAHLYVRLHDRMNFSGRWAAAALALGGFSFLAVLMNELWQTRTADQWATVWQVYNRSLVGVAFLAMALGSLLAPTFWQRALANPALLFFAAISYNLYLYHQALARLLLAWRVPPFAGSNPHNDPTWQLHYTVGTFVLTVLQATLITYAFERPLLRMPPERWRRVLPFPWKRQGSEGLRSSKRA